MNENNGLVIFKDNNGLIVKASSENDSKPGWNFFLTKFGACWRGLKFQTGNPKEVGLNGYTNESMLTILIHRLKALDNQVPTEQNKVAISHMEAALEALNLRIMDRALRGVTGTTET